MSEWHPKAKTVFMEALGHESPEARRAYLDEACGGDDSLRDHVEESLLEADAKEDSLLDRLAPDPASMIEQPIAERPGATIGPYKLLQEIGEGGMGMVYLAEQREPMQRKVALKIIKPGMDTQGGDCPLRGRAAGAGRDGPPQHRQRARRGRHRVGQALLRDGASPGDPHHRVL